MEIRDKKYPKLTQVSAWRDSTIIGQYYDFKPFIYDGKPHGGYYTQEEAKEIVKYAADRKITVIPEIELPGHSSAVLAAYPELGSFDSFQGIGTGTIAAVNENGKNTIMISTKKSQASGEFIIIFMALRQKLLHF